MAAVCVWGSGLSLSILMFCPQFRPIVGGAERQAEKLAKALVQKGARVTVLTPRLQADAPLSEDDQGVAIRRFPLFDLNQRFPGVRGLGPFNLLQLRFQTMRAVNRHLQGVDVMHAHTASPLTAFAMQAAKRMHVPVVCKVAMAGARSDLTEVAGIGLGGRNLAVSMVRNMDCWVATTQAVAKSLAKWNVPSERVTLIPNGVELPVPDRPPERFGVSKRFLYLGRLSTNIQRDVPTLLRAFDRLASVSLDVELAVVGDGNLHEQTAGLVAQCRHSDRISMPGLQAPEPWLRWADCFVLPSRREGLSNALLEAMSHGLSCIANDIPPNREVLSDGEAGVLAAVEDEQSLFEAMLRMATDAHHADFMRAAALGHAKARFSIESVADKYVALYQSLIDEESR